MGDAIIFYSWSGHCLYVAAKLAEKTGSDLFALKDDHRKGLLNIVFQGGYRAHKQHHTELASDVPDLSIYKCVTLVAPVWFGYPAPAFNNVVDALPLGSTVKVILVSDSGKSNHGPVEKQLDRHGFKVLEFTDVKQPKHIKNLNDLSYTLEEPCEQ